MKLRPRAETILRSLAGCTEPITRRSLVERSGLTNDNLTPELGATDSRIRLQYEGQTGKDGYTADNDGRSLIGLELIGTAKMQDGSRVVDVFWITEKGRQLLD